MSTLPIFSSRDRQARVEAGPMLVLAVCCAAAFMAFVDVTIVNTAFPDIERSFSRSSLGSLSWIINAYTIVFAALLMPAGRIADLAGRKRVFMAGIALFTVASAACAAAPSPAMLIAARAAQGAGAALMIPTSLALMLPAFPPERRSLAIGIWGAANAVAAAVGPALGGGLVELSDWRLVFLINLPVGVLTLLAVARVLTEYRAPGAERAPDLFGTIASLTGGLLLALITVWRSSRHPVPTIETSLWRIPGFAGVNVGSFTSGVAFFAFMLGGTLFLTSIWGYTVFEAGLAMTVGAIATAIFAPLGGLLMGRYGERIIVFTGGLAFAASCFWMAEFAGKTPDFLGIWVPGSVLCGVGLGLVFPALAGAAVKELPPERLGAGIALNMTARQVGGAVGIALLVALLTSPGKPYDHFIESWIFCGVVAAVTAVLGLWLIPNGAPVKRARPAPYSAASVNPPGHALSAAPGRSHGSAAGTGR